MDKITVLQATCLRCGYRWIPRVAEPVACPKCHSPLWNKPRVRKVRGNARKA